MVTTETTSFTDPSRQTTCTVTGISVIMTQKAETISSTLVSQQMQQMGLRPLVDGETTKSTVKE
jgi:hypothetical protein